MKLHNLVYFVRLPPQVFNERGAESLKLFSLAALYWLFIPNYVVSKSPPEYIFFWYMWKWSCTSWFTLCDYHHKSLTKERLRARSCTHWLYYTGYVFLVALAFTVYRHHHRMVVLWPPVAQYSAYSTLGLSSSLLLLRLENLYFIHGTQEGWKSEMLWWGHLKNVLVDEITQPYIILTLVLGNYGFKCLPFWEGEGA